MCSVGMTQYITQCCLFRLDRNMRSVDLNSVNSRLDMSVVSIHLGSNDLEMESV